MIFLYICLKINFMSHQKVFEQFKEKLKMQSFGRYPKIYGR